MVLALLVEPPRWGVIALPLLSRLYVRTRGLPSVDPKHRPEFRTKLVMAVDLMRGPERRIGPKPAGRRGSAPTCGARAIDLANRAGRKRGGFDLYDGASVKRCKVFLAAWRPAGGVSRVVLVDEPTGWRA